jgi:hypothetical protein
VRGIAEPLQSPIMTSRSLRLSRRRFLAATGAALVAPVRARATDKSPRFGVRAPFPTNDLAERAGLVRALGYDGIELGPEYLDRSADEIRAALAGTGIAVSAVVGSLKLLDPDPDTRAQAVELDKRRLQLASALGASGVIEVPAFGPCRFPAIA